MLKHLILYSLRLKRPKIGSVLLIQVDMVLKQGR